MIDMITDTERSIDLPLLWSSMYVYSLHQVWNESVIIQVTWAKDCFICTIHPVTSLILAVNRVS